MTSWPSSDWTSVWPRLLPAAVWWFPSATPDHSASVYHRLRKRREDNRERSIIIDVVPLTSNSGPLKVSDVLLYLHLQHPQLKIGQDITHGGHEGLWSEGTLLTLPSQEEQDINLKPFSYTP